MITQGPFDLTLNTLFPLSDPGANSNNPATAVQLQNASPFAIDVNAGGIIVTIASFTAQTVPYGPIGGQPLQVVPEAIGSSGQTRAPASLTVVWLLAGESAPMVDGPLTAAAIATTLAQSGISGSDVISATDSLAPGGSIALTLTGSAPWKLWNWGFIVGATPPTKGGGSIVLGGVGTSALDAAGYTELASNRLAGLIFHTGATVFNNMDQTVEMFLDYSAA